MVRVCRDSDVDDTCQGSADERPPEPMTARDVCLSLWDIVESGKGMIQHLAKVSRTGPLRTLQDLRAHLMYGSENPSRRRRTPMDVDAMVRRWVPIIRGLATAHDKATVDRCEFEEDEHLRPLLAAPVKQLREFYAALTAALKNDPTIPFFIWQMFEVWGDVVLKTAPDGDVKALKIDLAEEIARMVEAQVRPDLAAAITGALQWRSPEALAKIRNELAAGKPARMTGRSSCLFLEVGDATVML